MKKTAYKSEKTYILKSALSSAVENYFHMDDYFFHTYGHFPPTD